MRTLYLLRASNGLKETNANDVFKSGALGRDPSFTDSIQLALGGWTRPQSQGQAGRPPTIAGLDQRKEKLRAPRGPQCREETQVRKGRERTSESSRERSEKKTMNSTYQ